MKTLLLYLFVFLALFNHQNIIFENQQILFFFIEQLLPSLFLLCVLVQMLPFPQSSFLDFLLYKIFRFDTVTFFIILKAILLGNPAGSYMIQALHHDNKINALQKRRLINCCAIPSISFMLMSLAYITSIDLAYTVFFIHVLSIFILLFMTRKTAISIQSIPAHVSLTKAILFSLQTMAFILSYLFIIVSIKSLFFIYFPQLSSFLHLFMEFSSGVYYFAHHKNAIIYILICIGFGGFCSHLQIMDRCEFPYHHYLFWRICHIFLNLFLYFILFLFNFLSFSL